MRELATVPRRTSHFGSRVALLGLFTILGVTTWQATVGFDRYAPSARRPASARSCSN